MTTSPRTPALPAADPERRAAPPVNRAASAAAALATAYGAVRLLWQLTEPPADLSPTGTDLVVVGGWWAVLLCLAAGVLGGVMAWPSRRAPSPRSLSVAARAVSVALVGSGAMLLLDVVGGLLPGLGVGFFPGGAVSRLTAVGTGMVLWSAARQHERSRDAGCGRCGGRGGSTTLDRTPRWAYVAAYVSAAGCLGRIVAQLAVGVEASPLDAGASLVVFEVGFVLGGTLLPLALVHRWGRVWPRWVPRLAGRPVPRRLVLWPGAAVSGALTVYFGLQQVQMIVARLQGRNPFPSEGGLALPEAFFWVAVPTYVLWGAGMAVAASAYARRTRPPCPDCTG